MSANLAAEWVLKADAYLDAVRRCLHGSLPNVIVACYHCQQAAEKLVKALLVNAGVRHPRGKEGHDIGLCAACLPSDHPLRADAEAFDDLTDWATAFRYPVEDPVTAEPVPDADDVRGRLDQLHRFRTKVVDLLGLCGEDDESVRETTHLLRSPANGDWLRESIDQANAGKVVERDLDE